VWHTCRKIEEQKERTRVCHEQKGRVMENYACEHERQHPQRCLVCIDNNVYVFCSQHTHAHMYTHTHVLTHTDTHTHIRTHIHTRRMTNRIRKQRVSTNMFTNDHTLNPHKPCVHVHLYSHAAPRCTNYPANPPGVSVCAYVCVCECASMYGCVYVFLCVSV